MCDLIISLKENCVLIKKNFFFLSPQDAFSWSEVNSSLEILLGGDSITMGF